MMQKTHPSEWLLDRMHVGEASPQEQQRLEQGWKDNPLYSQCMSQREESFSLLHHQSGFDDFLEREFARHAALSELKEPSSSAAFSRELWWDGLRRYLHSGWGSLATVGVAVVCMIWVWPPLGKLSRQGRAVHTTKSQSWVAKSRQSTSSVMLRALHFRQGSPHSSWLRSKQAVAPGDLLQFSLHAQQNTHVMIVGMSEKGETYVVVPFQGKASQLFPAGRGRLPPEGSFELDDYVGWERFYLFASDRPFTSVQAKRALQRSFVASGKAIRTLRDVPGPWRVSSLLIRKAVKVTP